MRKIICLLFIGAIATSACNTSEKESSVDSAEEEKSEINEMSTYYIGTYTGGESQGIYTIGFNEETGEFGEVKLAAETPNPSYLAVGSDGHIYAVNEDLQQEGVSDAGISAWVPNDSGMLKMTDDIPAEGSYACYISINDDANYVLVANYGGGSVLSVPLEAPGSFNNSTQLVQHSGKGPNEARQDGPHAHSIVLSPDGEYALAADLGIDKVLIYKVAENGTLLPGDPSFISTAPGAGPRHISFHPNVEIAYVVNELNGTVDAYKYEAGTLELFQSISTLPEDFEGVNYCADIHVHPSGKFLYASNRGHGSIASYTIADDGSLTSTGHFTQDVKWPRNFMITENGKFILIANERGDDIIVAELDAETGIIKDTGKRINVPTPVCIVKYK